MTIIIVPYMLFQLIAAEHSSTTPGPMDHFRILESGRIVENAEQTEGPEASLPENFR